MHPLIAQQLAAEHRKDLLAHADRARLLRQARRARRAATLRKLRPPTRRAAPVSEAVERRLPAAGRAVMTPGGFDKAQKCSLPA